MRIAIYSRKSVDTGRGESVENQVGMCRDYINARLPGGAGAEIFVYEDEGFSGKSLERPEFQKMLADARSGAFDCIVCYRLDRISRSVSDFSALIEELNRRKIAFVCIREQFDTSTPMGRAMMYIASVFAQLERETIAERVRDNMLMLARTGRWLGGTPPTGYRSEKVREFIIDGRAKTCFRLKEKPEELPLVREIYTGYLTYRSLNALGRQLAGASIHGSSGRPYSLPGLRDILRNPVYCAADKEARDYFLSRGALVCFEEADCMGELGLLSYNKRDSAKNKGHRPDESEWIVALGRHRGLIPGRDWVLVQTLLRENAKKAPQAVSRIQNDYALLSGRITCALCGSALRAKRRSKGGRFDYICAGKLDGYEKTCACRNLPGAAADEAVTRCLLSIIPERADFCRDVEDLLQTAAGEGTPASGSFSEPEPPCETAPPRVPLPTFESLYARLSLSRRREFVRLMTREIRWDGQMLRLCVPAPQNTGSKNAADAPEVSPS